MRWRDTFRGNKKHEEYQNLLTIFEWEIKYNSWLHTKTTEERIQYLQKRLIQFLDSIKTETATPETQKKNSEKELFLKKYGNIDEFGKTLVTFVIKHPQIANFSVTYNNPLLEAKKDLEKTGDTWLEWYKAIIESLLQIIQTPTFERNTWAIEKILSGDQKKARIELFESFLREVIQKAGTTGKVQNIDNFKNSYFRISFLYWFFDSS